MAITVEYCPDNGLVVIKARQDHYGACVVQFLGCALARGDSNDPRAAVAGRLDIAWCIADKNRSARWEVRLVFFGGAAARYRHEVCAHVLAATLFARDLAALGVHALAGLGDDGDAARWVGA